jgi:hypothetical protein
MMIFLPFWIFAKIMVTKPNVLVIYSMLSGFPACLWNMLGIMPNRVSCAPMNVLDLWMSIEKNFVHSTNNKARLATSPSRQPQKLFGLPFWIGKWKWGLPTCCFRIIALPNPINRILEPSSAPICLCTETVDYTAPDEVTVYNLASSISLSKMVTPTTEYDGDASCSFNFDGHRSGDQEFA